MVPAVLKSVSDDSSIVKVWARQVLDSRGNPTVEVEITTKAGTARAGVPSGASTGIHEALELRDGNRTEFHGKGVTKAVTNVNRLIGPRLIGIPSGDQRRIDLLMLGLDGTENKSRLGANAILGVSMATARVAALSHKRPLYRQLSSAKGHRLPIPMMNVINGGEHADNGLAIQEFLIEPVGAKSFSEALRMGVEVYQSLKQVLKGKYGPGAVNVGDEGGFAPPMNSTVEALGAISRGIKASGHDENEVRLGVDAAASTFFNKKQSRYSLDGHTLDGGKLEERYASWVDEFALLTLEDPFSEEAFEDFASFTSRVGRKVKVIGDDLYATNVSRIRKGVKAKATNAVLIKLNQVGTVSETVDAIELTRSAGWEPVISHRSGETDDPFIAHLATAFEAPFIKAGAPARGERTAKYNELIRIEESLGAKASYAGRLFRKR